MFDFFKRNKESSKDDKVIGDTFEDYIEVLFDSEKIQKEKRNEGLYLYGWIENDGTWVEKGTLLYLISKGKRGTFTTVFDPVLSVESGVIELLVKEDQELIEGQPIYRLYKKGKYSNENLPENDSFKYYFNRYSFPEKYSFPKFSQEIRRLKKWHKQDGDWINKGDLIVSFCLGFVSKIESVYEDHHAEKSGFLNIALSSENFGWGIGYKQGELVYEINNSDEERIKKKFINVPEITFDDFTKTKIIKWKQVSTVGYSTGIESTCQNRKTELIFSFNNIDNKDFIVFHFNKKELKLNKTDIVSFLFENEKVLRFELAEVSLKVNHPNVDFYLENKIQISIDELNVFASSKMVKWKISSPKRNMEIIGGYYGAERYLTESNFQKVINKFAQEYIDLVKKEIDSYQPFTREIISQNYSIAEINEECYVYLMIDVINHHHKIGISNKPEWREKTLQSEKPTIELIASKKFVSRKIASSIEKALHSTYSEKRIRGEWFRLDKSDVNDIVKTLE
jgi:hypothetical protein